jgi:hypothetical protein
LLSTPQQLLLLSKDLRNKSIGGDQGLEKERSREGRGGTQEESKKEKEEEEEEARDDGGDGV